jgi:hypothetical protein
MEYFICIPPQQLVSLKKLLNTKVWWGDFATLCFSSLLLSGWRKFWHQGKMEGRKKTKKSRGKGSNGFKIPFPSVS